MNTEYALAGLVAFVALLVAISWIVRRNRAADIKAKEDSLVLDPDVIRRTRKLAMRDDNVTPDVYAEVAKSIHRHPIKRPADPLHLTARELERVNIRRRLAGRQPMSRQGFKAAIAAAPRSYRSGDDWLNWFLLYEFVLAEHGSPMASVNEGITVIPGEPGGGLYGGGGASGGWQGEQRPAPSIADPSYPAQSSGAGLLDDSGGPATAPSDYRAPEPSYTPPDPAPASSYSAPTQTNTYTPDPTPTPSYTAPDPTPSYSAPDSGGGGFSGGGDGT